MRKIDDPGRLAALLTLVEKITTVAPQQTHLMGAALREVHDENEAHKKDAQEAAVQQRKDEARKQHDALVLEQATAARARLDEEEDAKKQRPLDQKVVTEADKIEHERLAREDAARKAAGSIGSTSGITLPDPRGPAPDATARGPLPLSSASPPPRVAEPTFPRKIEGGDSV